MFSIHNGRIMTGSCSIGDYASEAIRPDLRVGAVTPFLLDRG